MGSVLLRRLWENLGTLLLAFALAFAVWVSAVVANDPNEERTFPRGLALEVVGQDPAIILSGDLPSQVTVRLSAPSSLWNRLTSETNAVKAYIDISNLESGEHEVPIQIETTLSPVRVVEITPSEVTIELEHRATEQMPIEVELQGDPALGFQIDNLSIEPETASVSGPASLVADVVRLNASLDVSGARESLNTELVLLALDEGGNVISGVDISPETVNVVVSVLQSGGYRDVAVKVETFGIPAPGFRVSSITVSPPIITLFSTNPELVASIPGFVSTQALDLTGAEEDIEARLSLALPDGISLVGEEQNVDVVVGISPIESSLSITENVEIIGLGSGLTAQISPESVSVILSGPLAVLEGLQADDVRLIVDLTGLEAGTHLVEPLAEILPDSVSVVSISPSLIEVVISEGGN